MAHETTRSPAALRHAAAARSLGVLLTPLGLPAPRLRAPLCAAARRSDLDGGKMLTETIGLSERTLVVLDQAAVPLSRLWCLYEIAVTYRDRLKPLTHGFTLRQIAQVFKQIDVASAKCFSDLDRLVIHALIQQTFGGLAQLTDYLKALMGELLADAVAAEGALVAARIDTR